MTTSARATAILAIVMVVGVWTRVSAFGHPPRQAFHRGPCRSRRSACVWHHRRHGRSERPSDRRGLDRRPRPDLHSSSGPRPRSRRLRRTWRTRWIWRRSASSYATGPFVVDELRVGGSTVRRVPIGRTAFVANQGDAAPFVACSSPASFPGLLFVLDYPGGKLKLAPGALPAPEGQQFFEYPTEDQVPTVRVDVSGHPFVVQVDSNAPGGLTLPSPAGRQGTASRPTRRSNSAGFQTSLATFRSRWRR